jgi:RNA polymerase sigma factor (sigma-70 family)
MEGYTLRPQSLSALRGPSPLLRLASDERLIELTRGGQQAAFEVLVSRYHARLLAFCRHMLRSREDAEDVLQEVFAAAFNAIMADTREINARPWLYRIARNRSLNHLRRNTAIGVDSMDQHFADAGQSTSEKVHKREEFRLLLEDIGHLPETQRSALVLREMDALSYEQIAQAMETTVPGIKSLLVRARIGLAEAAEARKLSCSEVRLELGAAAEGISSLSAPVRRHVKDCERCRGFRTQLRANNRALAAIFPLGPLILLKKTILFKLGVAKFLGFGGAGAGSGAAAGAGAGGAVATGTAAVATTGGLGSLAAGAVVVKAVAVVATVAVVAAVGASIHLHSGRTHPAAPAAVAVASAPRTAAVVISPPPTLAAPRRRIAGLTVRHRFVEGLPPALFPATTVPAPAATTTVADTPVAPVSTPTTPAPATTVQTSTPAASATPTTQEISTTTTFPSAPASSPGTATGATGSTGSTATTATGATGATGATSTSGATGATGSSGSAGSGEPTDGADQSGASGPTGASGAGS